VIIERQGLANLSRWWVPLRHFDIALSVPVALPMSIVLVLNRLMSSVVRLKSGVVVAECLPPFPLLIVLHIVRVAPETGRGAPATAKAPRQQRDR
jgi:hypothetical protein